MKHRKFIIDPQRAVKTVILVGFLAMCFPTMATDCGLQGMDRDTTRKEDIFICYETMPSFRGGKAALMKYLQEHVVYPPEAAKDSIQGRVVVELLIDSLGYVGEVKVVRSVHELLDQEAIRVVKTLPRFAPGRQFGKAVSMWYTLPVTFKLKSPGDEDKDEEVQTVKREVKVKQNAQFPGEEDALVKFIKENTKYPPKAAKKKIHGSVSVEFLIGKTGKVSNVRVIKSSNDKDLDREAVRVIKSLPDFIPARVNGEPVETWIDQQVRFEIPNIEYQWTKSVKVLSE